MMLTIPAFANGAAIPEQYAFCQYDAVNHTAPGTNKNPEIVWSKIPDGTQSLALICVDDSVPKIFTDANKAGKIIPEDMPRGDFYHWVVIDIDPKLGAIKPGQDAHGITPGGKQPGRKPYGVTGVNSYGKTNGGYDGPGPPWNDQRVHHYHFHLYALDIPSLNLTASFTGPAVLTAMQGHILAQSSWMGTYTLNPNLRQPA